MCIHFVDIYKFVPVTDDDGTVVADLSYADTPTQTAVLCNVFPEGAMVTEDRLDRVMETWGYTIDFPADPAIGPRDKLVWVDPSGVTRLLFAAGTSNNSGRSMSWSVGATETR